MSTKFRRFLIGGTATAVSAGLVTHLLLNDKEGIPTVVHARKAAQVKSKPLPTREALVERLKNEDFDVLVIGGGASGAGCALDAQTRGLKTALIEGDDFASGTSSRSTKLIHGGVRYLQAAIMKLDLEQYRMVKEALHERLRMIDSAPHLAYPLPIMLPIYKWWEVPYMWIGLKMYDAVAGRKNLKGSYYLSKKNALELFPMLRKDKLCGAIIYYDGQHDDARMNLAIAITAIRNEAVVVNHVSAVGLVKEIKGDKEIICAVKVRDELTKEEWTVPTKCVINATGPFTDAIRIMDNPSAKPICTPSSGSHIVLPGYYSPEKMGLLDPATKDGRVIFFLPWQKSTIAGTTDLLCELTHHPKPTEDEICFILDEVKHYLNPDVEVRRGDVLSAWSGIRPLVSDPNKGDTQSLARNHIIHVSKSNLITLAGGKWTTYREMAEETINKAILACNLKPCTPCCQTRNMILEGGHKWTPTMYIRLVQDFGLECEVAQHLASAYGDRAFAVAKMASITGKRWPIIGKKIHPEFPYIDAEIRYGVTREYARTAVDMIARRLRLAFLNVQAAEEALDEVINIMCEELKWSDAEKEHQKQNALEFINNEMGKKVNRASRDTIPINLSKEEIQTYIKRFKIIDQDNKGFVSINDIRRSLKSLGIKLGDDEVHLLLSDLDVLYNGRIELSDYLQQEGESEVRGEEIHEILKEIDANMNGQVELDEYLQMMSALKSGHITYSRFARIAELEEAKYEKELFKKKISVERSGGGL